MQIGGQTDRHCEINGRLSRVCEGKRSNEATQRKQERKGQKTDMLRDSLSDISKERRAEDISI
jgi:hypothetical protein